MPESKQADPAFALVRNKATGGVYVTRTRGEDIEVLHDDLETDGSGLPILTEEVREKQAAAEKKAAPAAKEK